jgi:hypothetical protein
MCSFYISCNKKKKEKQNKTTTTPKTPNNNKKKQKKKKKKKKKKKNLISINALNNQNSIHTLSCIFLSIPNYFLCGNV